MMTQRFLSIALTAALGVIATSSAHAAPQAAPATTAQAKTMQGKPSDLVLKNSERVLSTIEARRAEFNSNRAALNQFIYSEFNTMFDRDYAARQVLGRHARGASDADVKAFADALTTNLMQRYGSSLISFNTKLTPRVKSETALPRNLGVKVSSELARSGGDPIPVDYLMRKQANGTWKVFDVMVEGVSFVQTFRQQFDAELQRKSIAEVAKELRQGQIQADAGTK